MSKCLCSGNTCTAVSYIEFYLENIILYVISYQTLVCISRTLLIFFDWKSRPRLFPMGFLNILIAFGINKHNYLLSSFIFSTNDLAVLQRFK